MKMHHIRANAIPAGHVQTAESLRAILVKFSVVEGCLIFPRFVQLSTL